MTAVYVRIEAVNLNHFVYDTNDLSTIRGSGILLLDWPRLFEPENNANDAFSWSSVDVADPKRHVRVISSGASSLLLHVERKGSPAEWPQQLRAKMDEHLRTHEPYCFATFVVDVTADEGRFYDCYQRLVALNHRRQLAQMNLAVPAMKRSAELSKDGEASVDRACDIDGLRPGTVTPRAEAEDINRVCLSVNERRETGQLVKRRYDLLIHSPATEYPENFWPTWDLDRLTVRGKARPDYKRGVTDPLQVLHHKMAVIYIDGNGFSAIQDRAAAKNELRSWDKTLQNFRRGLVKTLIQHITQPNSADWQVKPTAKDREAAANEKHVRVKEDLKVCHRIETLLWGGDEHIWVVPAWKGIWTLDFFFQHSSDWKFGAKPLTHSAGVVFCHHNAPIRDVVLLARRLAESAKRHGSLQVREGVIGQRDGSTAHPEKRKRNRVNAIAYQVLESFDHLGDDFDRGRSLRRPPGLSEADMIVTPAALRRLCEDRDRLEENEFPKRRLFQIARALFSGDFERYRSVRHRMEEVCHIELRPSHDKTRAGEIAAWMHLIDLWDYLPPRDELVSKPPAEIST
jgi:hypothetical protein